MGHRALALALAVASGPGFRAAWPDKHGHDDHGRGPGSGPKAHVPGPMNVTPPENVAGSEEWFAALKKVSGPKGSNPGGVFEAPDGGRWYVKHYQDPEQGAGEVLSSEIYRRLGLEAPHSVLGKGGRFASRWMDGVQGTVGSLGLTKELASRILDGFVADVLTVNWDAVGTGLDNVVVTKDGGIARVDQGGTLLHRAQGAPKPLGVLHGLGEWDSLRKNNAYYAQVFQKAGVPDGDALGHRAIAQVDRVLALRPKGGWRSFAEGVVPRMPAKWHADVGGILDARTELLRQKRDALAKALGVHKALAEAPGAGPWLLRLLAWDESKHPRHPKGTGDGGEFAPAKYGGGATKKLKSGKVVSAPATKAQIAKAWEMYQSGLGYAKIEAETGLNPKQAATIIFKVKKKQGEAHDAIAAKEQELGKFGAGGHAEAEASVQASFAKEGDEAALGAQLASKADEPKSKYEAVDLLSGAGLKWTQSFEGDYQWVAPNGDEYGPKWPVDFPSDAAMAAWKEYHSATAEEAEYFHKETKEAPAASAPSEINAALHSAAKASEMTYDAGFNIHGALANNHAGAKLVAAKLAKELGYTVEQKLGGQMGLETIYQFVAPDGTKVGPEYKSGHGGQAVKEVLEHAQANGLIGAGGAVAAPKAKSPAEMFPPKWGFGNPGGQPHVGNGEQLMADAGYKWGQSYNTGIGKLAYTWKDANGNPVGPTRSYEGGKAGALKDLLKGGQHQAALDAVIAKANDPGQQAAAKLQSQGWSWGYDHAATSEGTDAPYTWRKYDHDTGTYQNLPGAGHWGYGNAAENKAVAALQHFTQATAAAAPQAKAPKPATPATLKETAEKAGYVWTLKTTGPAAGKSAYAWFKDGTQQSAFEKVPAGTSAVDLAAKQEKAAQSINYGVGPLLPGQTAPAPKVTGNEKLADTGSDPAPKQWPIGDSVSREVGAKYPKTVQAHYHGWVESLGSGAEYSAIHAYTGSAYASINAALRQSPNSPMSGSAKHIASALAKAPTPPPPDLVWRGVNHAGFSKFIGSLANGEVFRMDGFSSTSISPTFAAGWGHSGALMEIMPAKGGYVRPISGHKNEYEFILPHGSRFRYRGKKTLSIGGTSKTVHQLEHLP